MNQPNQVFALVTDLLLFLASVRLLGVAVLSRRRGVVGSRVLLSLAAGCIGAAAFLHGAGVVDSVDAPELVVLRLVSAALLTSSCIRELAPSQRATLVPAAALLAAAEGILAIDGPNAALAAQCLASVMVGSAVMAAMRDWFALRAAAVGSALIVTMVVALAGLIPLAFSRGLREEELRSAEERAREEGSRIERHVDRAIALAEAGARLLSSSSDFARGVAEGDTTRIREALAEARTRQAGLDVLAFFSSSGGAPAAVGATADEVAAWRDLPMARAAVAGDPSGGIGPLGKGAVAVLGFAQGRVGAESLTPPLPPVVFGYAGPTYPSLAGSGLALSTAQGAPVGFVVAGTRVDPTMLSRELGQADGVDITLIQGSYVSSTLARPPSGAAGLLDSEAGLALAARVKGADGLVSARGDYRGSETFVALVPVRDSSGEVVATLAVTVDGHIDSAVRDSVFPILFLVLSLPAAVLLVAGVVAGVRIERPVSTLTRVARRLGEGDLSAMPAALAGGGQRGDVASLGASIASMAGSLGTMETDLREAEAQLRAILGGLTEGLLATDETGVIVLANAASEALVGEAPLGRRVSSVISGQDRNGVSFGELLSRHPSEGSWFASGFLRREGERVPVAISCAPIQGQEPGSVIGAVYIVRDVHREFEVEQMKTEFLAGISHELRTPLAPIRGYAEMLSKPHVDAEQSRRFVEGILASSEELERVVDILVDFAAIEADRFTLQVAPVNVGDFLASVVHDWRAREPDREWVVGGVEAGVIEADVRLLRRSLDELVDNAVRYSPANAPISLRAESSGPVEEGAAGVDQRFVGLVVEDVGGGLTPQTLAALRLEDPFASGSTTTSGGFGLGLPFVRRVARAHGGRLVAENREGGGSVFVIEIPNRR